MYMTQDSDKTPKRPQRKTTRKVTEKKTTKSKKENISSDATDKEFRDKIQKALQANLTDIARRKNLSRKQVSVINSFIEEHLGCFILLGYSANGEPVSIVNAPTQKDSDSLGTMIQKFLVKYIDPPPPTLPPNY